MSLSDDQRRERKLRELGRIAAGPPRPGAHLDEPLLALIRAGDHDSDLDDALTHAAHCADCRARLTEGQLERRALVVMAIEAPKGSQDDLARAAYDAHARLLERGDGRWTAVVDADKSDSLVKSLDAPEGSLVSRLAALPVEVPLESDPRVRRLQADTSKFGTDAVEVQAWAKVASAPKRKVSSSSPGWVLFGLVAVAGAAGIAYWLASQ
jgi:hypothetical protein